MVDRITGERKRARIQETRMKKKMKKNQQALSKPNIITTLSVSSFVCD